MVKLKKVESIDQTTNERFEGGQGQLWKSGEKGTATMFSSWVSSVIRANTINNSAVRTRREYVTQDGGYETLNISFGRKDTLPLDIRVGVPQEGKSKINLKYRQDPRVARWVEKDYVINDPMALSVDPTTKKLISVVFTGSQFSFADQGTRNLAKIPGYKTALWELTNPILDAAKILDAYDDSAYKSRNLADFEALPEVQELKELYHNWEIDVDSSKIASQNKVTYIFNHPTNPDFNFTVYFRDEGGSDYRVYATYQDKEMNLANLYSKLKNEVERLEHQDDEYSEYESRDLAKEMKVSGASSLSMLEDKDKLDAFVKKVGDALDDFSLARVANIDITQNADGSEDWELILKTQHGEKSVFWHTSNDGKVESFRTNFGYDSSLKDVKQDSPFFFNEITKAAEKFLDEYGAYNRNLATITDIDNQIVGGKDWIQSYNSPDYDLANWADRTLAKIEPEIEKLQEDYNLELTRKVEDDIKQSDSYTDLLAKYGVVQNDAQTQAERDRSGKIVFTGSYVDKAFIDHLLELRVNFDRGDKFVVWIRPDLKGNSTTKAVGQSDLSFFNNWVKENVAARTAQRNSDNFRQAISQELINLGAIEGTIKGTLDIATSKIKGLTIDLKVTNNKVLVNAYRDGKIIAKLEYEIPPFSETPVKVAKMILNNLSKSTKESFPSMDRDIKVQEKYWDALFDVIKTNKHKDYNSTVITVGNKKCRASFSTLGSVSLSTMTGKHIKEEQFCADIRYLAEDAGHMIQFLNENRNRM